MLYVSFVAWSHGFGWRCDAAKIGKIVDFELLSEEKFTILGYGFFCIFAAQRKLNAIKKLKIKKPSLTVQIGIALVLAVWP